MRRLRPSCGLVWLVALSACAETEPLTQIVVVVDSDWSAIDRFEIEVRDFAQEPTYDVDVRVGDAGFPRTLALVHEGGPLGPIAVTVRAYEDRNDEALLVEPRSGIYFVEGKTRLLRIDLLAACFDERLRAGRCEGMACVKGDGDAVECVSSAEAAELTDWTGGIEPLGTGIAPPEEDGGPGDGGAGDAAPAGDGGDGMDAASDAGGGDAMPPDRDAALDGGDGRDAAVDAGVDARVDAGVDAGTPPCAVTCAFLPTVTPNADAVIGCAGTQCLITCDPGFVDCDGDYENGCERALADSCGCPGLPAKRKQLTVDGARVAGSLADFPLLVATTDAQLAAGAAADGADICFTAADGLTRLPFELERYTSATGTLLAWVAVPSMSSGVDTGLYLYYGDGTSASRATPAAVWDADYAAVYHFDADARDSTANANDGTVTGATVGGSERLGGVAAFLATGDVIDLGSDSSIDNIFDSNFLPGGGTLEVWFRPESFGENGFGRILDKASDNDSNGGWGLFLGEGMELVRFTQGYLSGSSAWGTPTGSIPTGAWSHVALTYSTGGAPTLYLNGAQASLTNLSTGSFGTDSDASARLRVGNSASGDRLFDGVIDEVRLSTTDRSSAWLQTAHANQIDPAGFVAVGAEEAP